MERLKIIIIAIAIFVIPVVLSLALDWLIATSNLPDWFKFALLKR